MNATEEISLIVDEIRDHMDLVDRELSSAKSAPSSSATRREKLRKSRQYLDGVERNLQLFLVEVRRIPDSIERAKFEKLYREFQDRLQILHQTYDSVSNLKDSQSQNVPAPIQAIRSNYQAAADIQDKSIAVLQNARRWGAEAESIGAAAHETLVAQTERIAETREVSRELNYGLRRARRELLVFVRQAATDKCLILLLFLVTISIVFVIVWHAWLEDYLRPRGFNPFRLEPLNETG